MRNNQRSGSLGQDGAGAGDAKDLPEDDNAENSFESMIQTNYRILWTAERAHLDEALKSDIVELNHEFRISC